MCPEGVRRSCASGQTMTVPGMSGLLMRKEYGFSRTMAKPRFGSVCGQNRESCCVSVKRCINAGFRRDLQFPRISSSAMPRSDFPPKISALQPLFFRQRALFQDFLSSGSLRFRTPPKISALKGLFFRQTNPFQGSLSSGSLRSGTSPKELSISKHFFRQGLQFSPYSSSKIHFITGLPKVVTNLHPLPELTFS